MSTNQQLLDSIKNTLKSILAPATKTKSGLLSANDKDKLDTIARSANNYTHPDSTVSTGTYTKVTVDIKGHITEGSNPTTLAGYGITDAATNTQGDKADSAIQSITIGGVATTKTNGVVDIPAYPTTLPANNTVHTYSKTGTSPISGKGVYAALCTLDKTLTAAEGYAISSITQTDGLLSAYTEIHIPTKISELENDLSFSDTSGTVTSITLTADSPIKIDNTAAITGSGTRKISHNNSGVTAGDYGDTTNQTPGFGATFKVPSISVNATGHVTKVTTHTVKIPNHMYHSLRDDLKFEYERDSSNNITATYITHANDTISAGTVGDTGNERTLAFGGTFKVPCVEYDKKGHIVSASTISLKLPSNPNVNTTYSFAGGTNKFTVTPSTGSAYDVEITPSINLASQVTGILPIANGGTGASDAATARTNLGITPANIGAATSGHNHSNLAFKANGSAVITYNGTAPKTLNIIPGTGLGISSTTAGNITINHSNSITEGTISGSAGSLTFGGTITIPSISYDAQGHIKSVTTTTMTMPANPNIDTKVLQTAVTSADYTSWRSLIFGNSSGTEGFSPATTTSGVFVANTITCQPSTGTVRAYTLKSPVTTSTHLAGNKGTTIINSTASAGSYTMLAKLNSTNGYFTDGVYQNKRVFNYTAKSTVDDGTNSVTKSLTLLDESGNSSFPGTITANAGIVNNNFNVKDLTVTGSTTIGNVLTMNDSKYTRDVLYLYDDEDDHNYGSELCIQGNGNLFIGGGDSANGLRNAFKSGLIDGDIYSADGERMYLTSDSAIYFYSNVQTPADRRGIVYDGYGILRPLVTNTRQLGSSEYYWNKAYINEINGALKGNATSADKVNKSLTVNLDGIDTTYDGSCETTVGIKFGSGFSVECTTSEDMGGSESEKSNELIVSHEDYITAGTASGSATKTLTFGGTFDIPTITYNAQGHITETGVTTMTMPSKLPNSLTIKTNGTSVAVFDGSAAKTVNITPASIGASKDGHEHDYLPLAGGTLTGQLIVLGPASSKPIIVRGLAGSDGNGNVGDLFLQHSANSKIFLGNEAEYSISADGGQYSGNSASATKLTTSAGSATQPVYFSDGKPVSTTYTLGKSVPSDAVFTDTKATQTNTTTSADYRLALSYNANDTTETQTLRKSGNFLANPATGEFYAKGYRRITITGQTLDINTLNLSAGSPMIMKYIETTSGGAANITNIPVAGQPFILDVELIRWASTTDYITKQTFISIGDKYIEYIRYCTSGSWAAWVKRIFTDTHYTSKNVVGSSTATANTTTALTNGNVYINSVENGAVTSTHKISGSGMTTVTTKANDNGNIIITTTHPTSAGNKHIPSGGANGDTLMYSASGTAVWHNDYVVGTQTASTNAFTGTLSGVSALYDGLSIRYYLPYAGTTSAATLKLTLSASGTTTAAIPIYRNNGSTFTNQCGAGSILYLTYRTATNRWTMSAQYDYDTFDRLRHSGNIKCNADNAIVTNDIIVAKDGVYYPLKTGTAFNITQPILYSNANIAVNATSSQVCYSYPAYVTTTQSITLTSYKPVFIKGTLSGNTFTPISTAPLTQTIPTSDDGYQYILLGNAYDSTHFHMMPEHPIFAFKGGSFGQISGKEITEVTTSGSGNAVTAITASDGTLTVTKGSTFLTAHPTISKSTDTTSTASPSHGGTFTVIDSVTRDGNGHVTKVNTKTITLPTDKNTDTKVTNAVNNTTKAYLTGTTNSATNTGTQVFDNGVYLTTTAGQMNATSYKVAENVTIQYNSTEQCLNFVFS